MDNKLLEQCIKEVLQDAHDNNKDVLGMAQDLSNFHELIADDVRMFSGFKLYSIVSHMYHDKLLELGIIEEDEK